jgi:hypothetical protein
MSTSTRPSCELRRGIARGRRPSRPHNRLFLRDLAAFLRAVTAGIRAAFAVFVVGLAAFRSAGVADFRAERTEAGVKLRSATHESCCCPANVGAVDAKARALFSDPETLVGAMLAFLSASNASVDAALVFLVCHNSDLSVFLLVAVTSLERSDPSCNRNTLRFP